jgi:hypothetical protein
MAFCFHSCAFWIGNTLPVVSVLLCCKSWAFLQVKNLNLPQKPSVCTVTSNFHVTDCISMLYGVLFIIQESLLNVYLLKVPDLQNWSICTQETKVAEVNVYSMENKLNLHFVLWYTIYVHRLIFHFSTS